MESKLEAQRAESVMLICPFVLKKFYTEPSIGAHASYQISINLAKWL
jgi:hypothetical protein